MHEPKTVDENKEPIDDDSAANGIDEPEQKKPKIYRLPPCVPLEIDENGQEKRIRIPEPLPPLKSDDLDISKVIIFLIYIWLTLLDDKLINYQLSDVLTVQPMHSKLDNFFSY